MEVWRNIILSSSLSPEYYSELTPSSFPSAFTGRVPSLVVSLHPRSPHNSPSHSIITPPFSTPCHQPPSQAGCRLAISCTRSVEPLSGVECWLLVCLSGWLTVRPVQLKCLIWSMFVCGALSPRLILTALTVCADSLSPSCCAASLHPLSLYLHPLYILCCVRCRLSCWSSFSVCLYLEPLQGSEGRCGQLWL